MKQMPAALTLSLLLILSPAAMAQTTSNLQSELETLHNKWFAAFDKGDGETMDGMEVPNLVLVMPDGTRWSKPGPRAGKQKPTKVRARTLDDVQVRQFGDAAVLTGTVTTKGETAENIDATTVVWTRRDGQWLIASVQWAPVKAQK